MRLNQLQKGDRFYHATEEYEFVEIKGAYAICIKVSSRTPCFVRLEIEVEKKDV